MMRRGLKGCGEWEEDDGSRKRGVKHPEEPLHGFALEGFF